MRHDEASRHLAALVAGELEEPLRSTIEAHAEDCDDCRDWRETHRAVSQTMVGVGEESDHPSTEELADWAVQPEGASASDMAHLESCDRCREELELAREAILAARAATSIEGPTTGRPHGPRRARLALAAACVGAVAIGGLLVRSPSPPGDDWHLSNETLAGQQQITAASSIHADAVEIARGSEIVFEAGDVIALGDGFVVAGGATFAATTSNTEEPGSNGT